MVKSALQSKKGEDNIIDNKATFAQLSKDNFKYNILILDGRNTFHGMGFVLPISTDKKNLVQPLPQIQIKGRIPVEELTTHIIKYKT